MSSGIYSALSGALVKMQKLDVAVHNLANVGSTGFKASRLSFAAMVDGNLQNTRGNGMNFTRTSVRDVDFSQGTIEKTDRNLDLAIEGEGFFKLAGPEGFLYARQGNFRLDPEGNLMTATGNLQVVGEDGPLNFPHENVFIGGQGQVIADGAPIGRITLYDVPDRQALVQQADGVFALRPGTADLPADGARLVQGSLEHSNVNPLLLSTEIIEIKRAYAVYMQAMKTYSDLGEKANQIGQVQ